MQIVANSCRNLITKQFTKIMIAYENFKLFTYVLTKQICLYKFDF